MLTLRCLPASAVFGSQLAPRASAPSQIAIVVSKKVSRKAADRNRIKRRIRHQLQPLLASLVPDRFIVISANRSRPSVRNASGGGRGTGRGQGKPFPARKQPSPALLTCSAEDVRQEIDELLEQAHLLK